MYRKFFLSVVVFVSLINFINPAVSQSTDGVQSFQSAQDNWRRINQTQPQTDSENLSMLPIFQQDLGGAAVNNIINAENVFCYHISNVPQGYTGYTLDGMAVTGYCGSIGPNLRNVLFRLFFATSEFIDTQNVAQCVMEPKLMFRYVRGIDYTDVLVSSPCQAIAVFYGGKVMTYNFAPVAQVFDAMINSFQEQNMNFVSPALLNQIVPVGYPLNNEQQQLVRQAQQQNAVVQQPVQKATTYAPQAAGGWNNLRVNIQR